MPPCGCGSEEAETSFHCHGFFGRQKTLRADFGWRPADFQCKVSEGLAEWAASGERFREGRKNSIKESFLVEELGKGTEVDLGFLV